MASLSLNIVVNVFYFIQHYNCCLLLILTVLNRSVIIDYNYAAIYNYYFLVYDQDHHFHVHVRNLHDVQ